MKRISKMITLCLALLLIAGAVSPALSVQAAKIKAAYTILEGTRTKCLPTFKKGRNVKYIFTSADKKVAAVSKNGMVRGKKEGSTIIKVTKKQTGKKNTSLYYRIHVVKMSIKGAEKVQTGKTALFRTNINNIKPDWGVTDESIAKIDSNGKLTAIAPGETTVIASYDTAVAMKRIIITKKDGTSGFINGPSIMYAGESAVFSAPFSNAVWTSSNPGVVSIHSNTGQATAYGEGTAVIYAVSGTESVSVSVSVYTYAGASLRITSPSVYQLDTYNYMTSNKSGTKWYISNTNVASVDLDTGLLYAKNIGTTRLIAVWGGESVYQTITITSNGTGSLDINGNKSVFSLGTYTYLTANVSGVIWSSSDSNVVTIEPSTGLLYARSIGSALIYASYNGYISYFPVSVIAAEYTQEQITLKTNAINAIHNIPSQVTQYNLDAVKTYLALANGKVDLALQAGVRLNDISNYTDYERALDSWLKLETVPGTNIPLAVQKVTDVTAIENAISSMKSAASVSSASQRLAIVNQIETLIIKAETAYFLERSEIDNYNVYVQERAALGLS